MIYLDDGVSTEYLYPHSETLPRGAGVQLLVDHENRLWLGDSWGLFVLNDVLTTIQSSSWARIKASVK